MRNKIKLCGNEGFTLVELIVVIAILAILAGVGVVGYSSYVKKANEAADRQLISDIEKALVVGAYADNYAPGIVGAIGISQDQAATVEGAADAMMVSAFGANWRDNMKLRSDCFTGADSAKIIAAIKAAQVGEKNVFDSVPGSSFYQGEASTQELVADVDEIASALKNVLDGIGKAGFNNFWGEEFHTSVGDAGLTNTWQNDQQTAANLTVFAAANGISKAEDTVQNSWIAEWSNPSPDTVSIAPGYVSELVMNYAQCVALNNYAKQNNEYYADDYAPAYADLEAAMQNMVNSTNYIADFNNAISDYWEAMGAENIEAWQKKPEGGKSQAQIDAEAFIASMAAVNAMEDNYVSTKQTDLLGSANAFDKAGAADVLDTMVTYTKMGELPEGEYVIVLSIAADGTPVISPTLAEK